MNRSLLVLIIFSLQFHFVSAAVVFGEEKPSEGAVLESISYEKGDNDYEKIIFKLNGTHIPKIFKIKGEKPRLVFDFIDTRYSDLINNIINTEGGLIKGVRVGIHDDPPKTRVVVDIKPEGKFEFEQDFLIQENVLSITFHPEDKTQTKASTQIDAGKTPKPDIPAPSDTEKSEGKGNEKNQPVTLKNTDNKNVVQSTQQSIEMPGTSGKEYVKPTLTDNKVDQKKGDAVFKKTADQGNAAVNPILEQMTEEKPLPVDPVLEDVTFEKTANDSEMVLFKLNDFYPPIVFGIEKGNPRVVCDFLDTDLAENVRSVLQTKGMYVSRVRTALHANPHKVRVVLDLVPNRNYDLQQVFFKEDDLFVIIINEFEEEPVKAPSIPVDPAKQ